MEWITNEVKALLASGLCGTLVRTITRPERNWKAWLFQMFIGLSAAVMLGQMLSHIIIKVTGADSTNVVHYAVGYIIGTEAERYIRMYQRKFIKDPEKEDSP